MSRKFGFAVLVILAVVTALLITVVVIGTIMPDKFSFKFFDGNKNMEIVASESYPVTGVQNINVDSKSLKCEIYYTDDAEVRAVLMSSYSERRQAELTTRLSGDTVIIEAKENTIKKIGIMIGTEYLEVYIPRTYAENVSFKTSSGKIDMKEMTMTFKHAEFKSNSGKLDLNNIESETYALSATSGAVRAATVQGSGSVEASSGSIRIDTLNGTEHTVKSTSGSIHLDAVNGNANVSCNSGSINIGTIKGAMHNLTTSSGSIRVEEADGTLSVSASSGGLHFGTVHGTADMKSSSGGISLNTLVGGGSFETSSGSVKLNSIILEADLNLKASSGTVRAQFERTPDAEFEASSGSGSIHTNFAGKGGKDYQSGTLGAGTYKIQASTNSGSIHLND